MSSAVAEDVESPKCFSVMMPLSSLANPLKRFLGASNRLVLKRIQDKAKVSNDDEESWNQDSRYTRTTSDCVFWIECIGQ